MRILFTGGGTGGHVFPILAIVRELKIIAAEEHIVSLKLFYMAPVDFAKELLAEEGMVLVPVFAGKWRRYFSLKNPLDLIKTGLGILQALWNMSLIVPDVIFSKGGYGAFPAVVAARLFRIPLIIHESDVLPGQVNQYSAKFAKRIGIAFTGASTFFPKERTALVGVPIRKRILGGSRERARDDLDIFSELPTVGFIGASQGAEKLNDAVMGTLKELTDEFEVIHQTGTANYENIKEEAGVILEFAKKDHYHPYGFLNEDELRSFYVASDLIVSRAGASSIFEIAAWAKPAILIPLRNSAQDHQRKNAYEYAGAGAAVVIEEGNLTPHLLLAEIKKILGSPELMKKMREAAQRFSRIDSAGVIAREILKLGTTH